MKRIFLPVVLLLVFVADSVASTWHTDFEKAEAQAKKENKPMLINFSGSDWCKPCMLLTNDIFETERFHQFATDSLVLLNVDFPRRTPKGTSKETIQQREQLAAKYNSEGAFPAVVLVAPSGEIIGKTGYKKGGVDSYIKHLKTILSKFAYGSLNHESTQPLHERRHETILMGAKFEFAAIHTDTSIANNAIKAALAEVVRIEKLISSWDTDSETSTINKAAGIGPVEVSEELFYLIARSKKISELTNGAFDLSFASTTKIWTFDRTEIIQPTPDEVAAAISKIDFRNIVLNEANHSVFLAKKGMKIGFGAIGKGYAANRAQAIMKELGIANGMVNAGGDLIAWGSKKDQSPWMIGVADPTQKGGVISWLPINDLAVVTSGDYERYALIEGEKYSHIIDPRTGYPVKGMSSVTVLCADAEIADALATGISVLGQEKGIALVNALRGVECLIVTENGSVYSSENITLDYSENE